MSPVEANNIIRAEVEGLLKAHFSSIPVQVDNGPEVNTDGAYFRMSVIDGEPDPFEIGDGKNYRTVAILSVEIYDLVGEGTVLAGQVYDVLRAMRNRNFSLVTVTNVRLTPGELDSGKFRSMVELVYISEELS